MKQAKRRLLMAFAAAGLALLPAGRTLAFTQPGAAVQIPSEPGKTVAGVQVSRSSPDLLSFEVPLYVTMAAVAGPELLCPDNYSIRNSSKAPDGSDVAIAVTGLTVQKAPGSTWTLTASVPTGKELSFSVGNVPLLAPTDAWTPADLKVAGSAFYSITEEKYLPIPNTDAGLRLPLSGTLPAGWSPGNNAAAAPQFLLQYTVSMLDKSGSPMEVIYQGKGKEAAQQSVAPTGTGGA